jgi:uncharacterized protein YyaL (SSP411 family)
LEQRPILALTPVDEKTLAGIQAALAEQFDARFGGFGFSEDSDNIPKFPEPPNHAFLLDRLRRRAGDAAEQRQAREMLLTTLDHIAAGGIYDHVGGGFHRYTVDRRWRIPHFEKMLADNAQLVSVYAEAYALTERADYRRVVEETLAWVDRELSSPEGGFYTALDAESDGEEGQYYRWERAELEALLSADEFAFAAPIYGFAGKPNFEEKYYCLQWPLPWPDLLAREKLTDAELSAKLVPLRAKLRAARERRARPRIDDKILTANNGLMIRGYADAGRLLKNKAYIARAETAAALVLKELRTDDGRLLRSYAKGEAKLNGYLEDYTFLIAGLLALHEASGDKRWLTAADELCAKQIELFGDEKQGGFFYTSNDHEKLLARAKEYADSALPSANGVAALNLLILSERLKKPAYRQAAERTIQSGAGIMQRSPAATPQLGIAAARWLE